MKARGGLCQFQSRLAVLRVPVALEIADQRRAEMAIGLLAGVDLEISAQHVERLLGYAERTAVSRSAHHARIGQSVDHALDRAVHAPWLNELVADQPSLRTVAFQPALVLDRLARDAVAGEARQPHIGGAGND